MTLDVLGAPLPVYIGQGQEHDTLVCVCVCACVYPDLQIKLDDWAELTSPLAWLV